MGSDDRENDPRAIIDLPKYERTPRKCLGCDVIFQSFGPQNRICKDCRRRRLQRLDPDDPVTEHQVPLPLKD